MTDPRIEKLVNDLAAAKNEHHLLTTGESSPQQLGPPATPTQIAKLERRLGVLPPSYRAFLELHDGWARFDGEARILSSEDYDDDWVSERIADLGAAAEDAGAANPFKTGPPIVLGASEQNFVILELANGLPGTERELVSYDLQEELCRFPDFAAFLAHELGLVRAMIRIESDDRSARPVATEEPE